MIECEEKIVRWMFAEMVVAEHRVDMMTDMAVVEGDGIMDAEIEENFES